MYGEDRPLLPEEKLTNLAVRNFILGSKPHASGATTLECDVRLASFAYETTNCEVNSGTSVEASASTSEVSLRDVFANARIAPATLPRRKRRFLRGHVAHETRTQR
jgi:hypothetical protein